MASIRPYSKHSSLGKACWTKKMKSKELQHMKTNSNTASLILAAGRGSRMKEYSGSKTLLPLVPGSSPLTGTRPIILEILKNLPPGPKAVVVNHKKEDVIKATKGYDLTYCEQPVLNGTGGALMAARQFLEEQPCHQLIITMGDVPLVRRKTYMGLIENLEGKSLTILGFRTKDRKQYGVLEIEGAQVHKIIEWKYWKTYSMERQEALQVCNSGIYAAKRDALLRYLSILAKKPHVVQKQINGRPTPVEEYFITDLVEYMCDDGLPVGYVIGEEDEVMGVDDMPAIRKAQALFQKNPPQSG